VNREGVELHSLHKSEQGGFAFFLLLGNKGNSNSIGVGLLIIAWKQKKSEQGRCNSLLLREKCKRGGFAPSLLLGNERNANGKSVEPSQLLGNTVNTNRRVLNPSCCIKKGCLVCL
jgi:hypothetical protein